MGKCLQRVTRDGPGFRLRETSDLWPSATARNVHLGERAGFKLIKNTFANRSTVFSLSYKRNWLLFSR